MSGLLRMDPHKAAHALAFGVANKGDVVSV
jgi:hypothetical protein